MTQDLATIIMQSAAMGAAEAIRRLHPDRDRISQRQAAREFGGSFLKRNADRLTVTWNGNRKEYSRSECEKVRASLSVAAIVARIEDYQFKHTMK